jgi:hypothetical protein
MVKEESSYTALKLEVRVEMPWETGFNALNK